MLSVGKNAKSLGKFPLKKYLKRLLDDVEFRVDVGLDNGNSRAKMVEVTYRKTIGETPYAMRVPK